MQCHRDLQLFDDVYIDAEFAFTVDVNSTEHEVTYYDLKGDQHSLRPKPNTLLMVRPGASLHCAGSIEEGGSRQMMKWIFTGDYKKQNAFSAYAKNTCGRASKSWRSLMRKRDYAILNPWHPAHV